MQKNDKRVNLISTWKCLKSFCQSKCSSADLFLKLNPKLDVYFVLNWNESLHFSQNRARIQEDISQLFQPQFPAREISRLTFYGSRFNRD